MYNVAQALAYQDIEIMYMTVYLKGTVLLSPQYTQAKSGNRTDILDSDCFKPVKWRMIYCTIMTQHIM